MNDSRSMGSSEPLAVSIPGSPQAASCLKHAHNLASDFLSERWPGYWQDWCDQSSLSFAHDSAKLAFCRHIDHGFAALLPTPGIPPRGVEESVARAAYTGRSATENYEAAPTELLAQTALIRRAEQRLAEPLWQLQYRLTLLSGKQVNDETNPLSPAYWCEAISRAFRMIDLPVAARALGYRTFESAMVMDLGELYDSINRYFVEQGVLPHLEFSVEEHASFSAKNLQRAASLWEARYQKGLYHSIRLLRHRSTEVSQNESSCGGVSAALLAERLLPLQQNRARRFDALSVSEPGDLPPVEPIERTLLTLENQQGLSPGWDEDALEAVYLVGQVFDYLQHDNTLPLTVRIPLSYLHIPFLRLALLDDTFFLQPEHPARQLLNELVEAGGRWVDESAPRPNDVQESLLHIISRLLLTLDLDVQYFADLLAQFRLHTGNLTHREERVERRALEKIRGQERWRDVRQKVGSEILRHTGNQALPSAVLLLLSQPWSEYMAFILMRYGVGSADWLACKHTTDQLLWTLEPKNSEVEREQQKAVEEALSEAIQAGLKAIGYDPAKGRKLLDAVQNLQSTARAGGKPEPAPMTMRAKLAILVTDKDDRDQIVPQASNEEEQAWLDRLQRLEPGTWMQHQSGRRKKVVWYDRRTLHFMLMNQQGGKVVMRAGLSLAADLAAGRLCIIEGSARPFFGRALEYIYRQLSDPVGIHASGGEQHD